jgi:Fe-S oxidoreductase
MDLCLECKACKAECPSNVDMAKLKYEFLAHYYRANGLPLRNRLFGRIADLARWGCRVAPLANWLNGLALSRWLLERIAGIDRRRPLPPFARQTFLHWFERHAPEGTGERGSVLLFHDTFSTYHVPEVAVAATRLLERLGYRVELAETRCCGRPLISKGMLGDAQAYARFNVSALASSALRGIPIVGLEPSCLLTLKDEYPDLLRDETARAVARQAFLLEEFLLEEQRAGRLAWPRRAQGRVLLHGHCHQKALAGTGPTVAVLRAAGYDVSEVDAGCCGMAGSFGFEREHYDLSVAIARRRLVPAVDAAGPEVAIAAPGISCRQQIDHLTRRQARHPAELLWDAIR